MARSVLTLSASEIDAVNGAGKDGFEAGYKAAKELGANTAQAVAAGLIGSLIEDAADALTGN